MRGGRLPFSRNWLVLRISGAWVRKALARFGAGRMLDVGCGTRPFLDEQRARARPVIGLEKDRRRFGYPLPQIWGDGQALPFRDASFDTVFTSQVLEHVPEPGRMCSEMARVLRPGGHLILTAPHIWGIHEEPDDYYRFTCYGLRHLAEAAGLEVVWICAMAGYWVTAGARFCHYVGRWERSILAPFVRLIYAFVQMTAWWLDRFHRVESDAWNYLLVARKPGLLPPGGEV